eukprot:TRINITY_DN41813_c0_g1_i1.p1 TRINITY_DN41813_c0_g1~~TRINITY_DN41813_c0_g1_i1.p1  ORF type:complete len:201 (-),score=35.70 TRINITY_DN41813_c0_g1_i1:119-721(-)
MSTRTRQCAAPPHSTAPGSEAAEVPAAGKELTRVADVLATSVSHMDGTADKIQLLDAIHEQVTLMRRQLKTSHEEQNGSNVAPANTQSTSTPSVPKSDGRETSLRGGGPNLQHIIETAATDTMDLESSSKYDYVQHCRGIVASLPAASTQRVAVKVKGAGFGAQSVSEVPRAGHAVSKGDQRRPALKRKKSSVALINTQG